MTDQQNDIMRELRDTLEALGKFCEVKVEKLWDAIADRNADAVETDTLWVQSASAEINFLLGQLKATKVSTK